jgi:hypothetical protein
MRDLDELFATLDRVPAPQLRERIRSSQAHVEPPIPPLGSARSRKIGTIAVALLIFLLPALYAWQSTTRGQPSPSAAPVAADPLSSIAKGWTELPLPPEPASGTSSIWTGTQLISWGGYVTDGASKADSYPVTGYAYDPSSNTWSPIPAAPAGRAGTIPIWTGSEALFLFGYDSSTGYTDGFAFDPSTGSWRTVPSAPIDPYVMTAVWTGSEVIAWGSRSRNGNSSAVGATYDPSTNRWQRIANAPITLNAATSVWTGSQMIVFGSLLDNGNHAATNTAIGAIYDPTTDTWTELPPSELSPQATSAAWTGDRLLAWDYITHSQTFNPNNDTWADMVKMPLEPSECYPDSAALTGSVFAFYCGEAALYDEASGTWKPVHGGMLDATVDSHGSPTTLWRFAELTPAGEVVFFQAEGITVSDNGTPCYGCSGSPMSSWVYRP